jgi:hypothetical protein
MANARWADASGVECVPLVSAGAEPFVLLARRFRFARLLLFLKLAIQDGGFRSVSHKTEVLLTRLICVLTVAAA